MRQPERTEARSATNGLLPGGVTVVIGAGPMGRMHVDLAIAARPRAVVVCARRDERLRLAPDGGIVRREARGGRCRWLDGVLDVSPYTQPRGQQVGW